MPVEVMAFARATKERGEVAGKAYLQGGRGFLPLEVKTWEMVSMWVRSCWRRQD